MKRGRKRGYAQNVTCTRHLMQLELFYICQRYIYFFFDEIFGKIAAIFLTLSLSGCTPHVIIQLHLVLSIKWQWHLGPVGLKDDTNARECVRIYVSVRPAYVCMYVKISARDWKKERGPNPQGNAIILATYSSSFSIIKYTYILYNQSRHYPRLLQIHLYQAIKLYTYLLLFFPY